MRYTRFKEIPGGFGLFSKFVSKFSHMTMAFVFASERLRTINPEKLVNFPGFSHILTV
jgi:hypothetical protein